MSSAMEKQDITQERINALQLCEKGWSAPARQDAKQRLLEMGLPTRRDEYWKYTRPDKLAAVIASPAAAHQDSESPIFDALDSINIVFIDGKFSRELSDDIDVEGITLELISSTKDADQHWAKDLYGSLERSGQKPVERPLAALNSAYAAEGILLHVKESIPKPLCLNYVRRSEISDVMLHHIIKLEKGASATILESGSVAARSNVVFEIEVDCYATLNHIRAQGLDHERCASNHIFSKLGNDSKFKSFTLTMNGILTRNETVIEMTGDDGIAHVAGASLGEGDFHHDDTVFITHDAKRGESRQVFKKVLRNGATGVFQGKILVKPDAQKTDGYQISQALLLDDDSQFLAKPELEIYADDVACSHGSTSGAVDEEARFYLSARGIPADQATNLLTLAFVSEALAEVESEDIAELIHGRLEGWLSRGI